MRTYIGAIVLAAALAGTTSACAGQLRVYDSPRQDYRWDRGEDSYYRVYLSERRLPYVEFRRLNRRDQQRYWDWRHSRGDGRDRVRGRGEERNRDRDRDHDRGRDRDRDRDRDRR